MTDVAQTSDAWEGAFREWSGLGAVRSLFASDLPWYQSKLNQKSVSAAEKASIQDFRVFFRFDIQQISISLGPEFQASRLSGDVAQQLGVQLDGILRMFESQVHDDVLKIQPTFPKENKASLPKIKSGILDYMWSTISGIPSKLISAVSTDPIPESSLTECPYPKLSALQTLLETLGEETDPVFKYGSLINLGDNKEAYKEAAKKLERFNEFLVSLGDPESSWTMQKTDHTTTAKNLAAIAKTREASYRLFDALVHLPLECGESHRGVLHLTGFTQKGEDTLRPIYDMFVSCCPISPGWHETHCSISDPSDHPGAASVSELCSAVEYYRRTRETLLLVLGGNHLFTVRQQGVGPSPLDFQHRISLHTLLEKGYFRSAYDGGLFTPRSKRLLVVNLARCLVSLFNTKWLQKEWDASDILFLCGTNQTFLLDMHRPYIMSTLSLTVRSLREVRSDISVPYHPAVLSFAKLLIEIERGRELADDEYEVSEGQKNDWLTISTILTQQLSGSLTGYYTSAIQACLDFARPGGCGRGSEVEYFYEKILVPLERELSHYPGAQMENAELRLDRVTPTHAPSTKTFTLEVTQGLPTHILSRARKGIGSTSQQNALAKPACQPPLFADRYVEEAT